MNKARRAALAALVTRADEIHGLLSDLKSEFETLKDEEQDYFDAMPESFQSGDKGERATAAIDALDSLCSDLDAACEAFENLPGNVDTACE